MSYSRRGAAYQYDEAPEKQASDVYRYRKSLAQRETRDAAKYPNKSEQLVPSLRALANGIDPVTGERIAPGIDPKTLARILPVGGIHDRMSPQDVQAASEKIMRYRKEQTGNQPPTAPQPVPAPMPPAGASGSVTRNSDGSVPGQQAQPAAAPVVGDRRTNPQGGHEQLMDSPTGPRWVGYVANPPGTGNTGTVTNGPTPFDYRGNRQFTNTQGERAYEYDPSKDTAMRQRQGPNGTAEVGSNNKGSYGVGSVRFVHDGRSNVDTAGNPIKAPVVAQAAPAQPYNFPPAPAKPPVVAAATPIAAPTVAPQVPPPVVNTTPPAAVAPVVAAPKPTTGNDIYGPGPAFSAAGSAVANAARSAGHAALGAVANQVGSAMYPTTPHVAPAALAAGTAAGQAVTAAPVAAGLTAASAAPVAGNIVGAIDAGSKAVGDAAALVGRAGARMKPNALTSGPMSVSGMTTPIGSKPIQAPPPPVAPTAPAQTDLPPVGTEVLSREEQERKRRMASAGTRPAYQF